MKVVPIVLISLLIFNLATVLAQEDPSAENVDIESVLNMDQKEKDKILSCVEIIANKLKKDQGIINSTAQGLADLVESNIVSQKITGDMLNKCYFSIEDSVVDSIFYNGEYLQPEFDKELLEIAEVDYSTYRNLNPNEFQLSPETQLLFMKLEKARNEFTEKNKNKANKGKSAAGFTLFGYSLLDIPVKINIIFSIVVFGIIMCGLMYLLKSVMNNPKKAALKKEKNKKDKTY